MDKIDKDSSSSSGVIFGECNVRRLLFADDLALLSSNKNDLQEALGRFSDAGLNAVTKINTAKTEIVCLSRQPVWYSLQTNGVTPSRRRNLSILELHSRVMVGKRTN